MTTIAHVRTAMQTVLTTLATQSGAELHYTRRPDQAKFTASTLVQTLVFGWLAHPDATLEALDPDGSAGGCRSYQTIIDMPHGMPARDRNSRPMMSGWLGHTPAHGR